MTVPAERIQYYTVHHHRDNFGCKEKDQDWEDFPELLHYLSASLTNFYKNLQWKMMSWSLKNIRPRLPAFPALYSLISAQAVFRCYPAMPFLLTNKILWPCYSHKHLYQHYHFLLHYHPSNRLTNDSCLDR